MLKPKPKCVDLTEEKWKQIKKVIHEGIYNKLQTANKLLEINKEVAAGLYTYALEEFGKYLLVDQTAVVSGIRRIDYRKLSRNQIQSGLRLFTKSWS